MFDEELAKAIEAARGAGEIIRSHYHKEYVVEHKGADQPVTVADREANEAILKILSTAFPDDGWLSEETVDSESRLTKRRVWIVDPLDGTKEFIKKIPEFAVSIALVLDRQPVAGVIYNPITDELFSAAQMGKAFLNEKSVQVTKERDLTQAKILASRSELSRNEWKPFEGKFSIVPSGGMAYKMVQVARGLADGSFSLQPKTEWDFAAGTLIVQEAGGVVTQVDGSAFVFNKKNPRATGIVHANPYIHRALVDMVTKSLK